MGKEGAALARGQDTVGKGADSGVDLLAVTLSSADGLPGLGQVTRLPSALVIS